VILGFCVACPAMCFFVCVLTSRCFGLVILDVFFILSEGFRESCVVLGCRGVASVSSW